MSALIRHFRLAAGACGPALLVMLAGGCEAEPSPHRYLVVNGTVIARHGDTGELTVHLSQPSAQRIEDERIHCIVTNDSEIYVNDRFTGIGAIAVGDHIELVGYRESERRLERFVVTFARIDHAEAPPQLPPELATSEPASAGPGGVRPAP